MDKNNTEQQVQVPQLVFDEMVECINDARDLFNKFLVSNLDHDAFDEKAARTDYANALAMLERASDLSQIASDENE